MTEVDALKRRVYEVEVLYIEGYTETDMNSASLESLAYETDKGMASGLVTLKSEETLSREEMIVALMKQGSDPDFLLDMLDDTFDIQLEEFEGRTKS